MRAVVQRVSRAEVRVEGESPASPDARSIGAGLVVLLGVAQGDSEADARLLADKVASLRIFEDDAGKMNRSASDISGSVLVVSQFTLLGDARKGNRPSFTAAAPPDAASALYDRFCETLRERGLRVATGVFRARMQVELVNEGPVTILLDSAGLF